MKYTEPTAPPPHNHFSEAEHKAANLGALMRAAKFEPEHNPYTVGDDRHEAWWRGFNWCGRLMKGWGAP